MNSRTRVTVLLDRIHFHNKDSLVFVRLNELLEYSCPATAKKEKHTNGLDASLVRKYGNRLRDGLIAVKPIPPPSLPTDRFEAEEGSCQRLPWVVTVAIADSSCSGFGLDWTERKNAEETNG